MSSLTPISTVLGAASTGWLSPDVLCDLLLYYSHYGFRLSATKPKPQPGALYLCDKTSMPDWFDDGLEWNLTGNGLLPIQNQPRLGFIQHQEERLSRRTSWLLDRENIILIHYLSTSKLQSNMTGIPATPALTLPMSAVLPTLTSPIITPPLPSNNNIMHTPMMGTSPFTSLPMPTPPTSGSFGAGFPSPSIAPSHRLAVPASVSNSPAATPSQTPTHLRHPSPFTDDSPRPLKRAHISSDRSSPPTERIPMRRETDAIMQSIKSSTSANNASTLKSTGDDKTDRNRARKAEVARACRKRKKAYIKTLEDSVNRLMTRLTQAETELDTRRMEEPNLYTNESPRMISDLSDLLVGTEEQDESVEASEDVIPLIQRLDQLQKMRWVRGLHYMRHAIECLDPSPLVRVAVHGLDQKDDWYAPNAAFQTLFRKYAKVSPVKIQEIMSLRSATSPIRSAHDQLLTDLHTAYTTASHHLPLLQKHYDTFCTHLTPTQIARIHVTLHNRTHLIPPTVHSQQQQQQQQHGPPLPRPMSLPTRSTSNSSATSGLSVAVPHTSDTKVKLSPPSSPNKIPSTSSSSSSTPTSRVTTRSASGVLPKRGSGSSVGTSGGGGVVDAERSSQSGGNGATSASTSSSASQSQSSPSAAPNSSPTTSSPPTPMAAAARVVPSLPIAALTLSSMSTTTFASPQASPFSSPSASPSMPMRLPLSPSLMNAPATAPSTTMTRAAFPLHTNAPALLKAQTLPTPKHASLMSSTQFLTKHTFHPTAMASIVSPIATKYSNNTIISLHATMSPAMSPAGSSQASSLSSTPASSAFQTPTQSRASSPSPSSSPPSLSRSMDSPPLSTMTSRESTPRMDTSLSSSQIQYGDSSPTVSEYDHDMTDLHATEPATTSSCTTTSTCTSESTSESTERTEHLASTLSTLAAAANEETVSV